MPSIEPRGAGVLPAIDGMDEADAVRAEMAGIVRLAAEPFLPRGVGYALGQAAKKLGIKPRRAEAYWWGEVSMVPAWEADRMRERRIQLLLEREARLDRELEEVRAVLSALEDETGAMACRDHSRAVDGNSALRGSPGRDLEGPQEPMPEVMRAAQTRAR